MDERHAGEREKEEKLTVEEQYERLARRALLLLDWCKSSHDRQKAELRWKDAKNFYQGRQWDGVRSFGIPGRSSESKRLRPCPVDNYFLAQVEGLVGDICDKPVDIQIKPTEPGDEQAAFKLEKAVQHIWYLNRGDRKLEFIARRAVLYGPLIGKVYWDPDWIGSPANPYVGEIRFFGVSPANFFVDPRVKAVDEGVLEQAEFVIYAVRRSLAYIRKHYPERGGEVQPDTYAGYVNTLDEDASELSPEDVEALVIEFWYKGEPLAPEYPRRQEEVLAPDLPRREGVHLAVVAGGILLKHVPYAYPWYPFVMEWMYPCDDTIYGFSDAHNMLLPQLVINKLNELAIEGAAIQSKGNWITDEGNIRNVAQFQRYAHMGGSVLPAVDANRIRREPGGNVPGSLFTHYKQEQLALETVTGRFDIAQGRAPRGVRAASAIAMLLQQGAGRVRQRARAMASFVQQLVQKMIDLIGMYYTEERLVRVVGSDNTITWDSISRDVLLKRRVYVDPETGEERVEEYIPDFDVRVVAGTDTTASKAYFTELAVQLYQMHVIDEIALLELLEFPRWREVLERKNQAAAQQGAAQRAAAQQALGGAAPIGGVGAPPEAQALQGAAAVQANPYGGIGGGGDLGLLQQLINSLQQGGL